MSDTPMMDALYGELPPRQPKERASGSCPAPGSAVCVRYGCWRTPLKYMKPDESHQTANGFFIIKITGWYCPSCGAGYGGGK